jgi:hypothetical protein
LAHDGLASRLAGLRQQAVHDCRSVERQVRLAAIPLQVFLITGWLLGLGGLWEALQLTMLGWNARSVVTAEPWQLMLTAILCLLTPALIIYIANMLYCLPRLAEWEYRECLAGLHHRGYGLLFTDEGLQRALAEIQHEHWSEQLLREAAPASIEAMLEQAAQNLPAALLLRKGAESQVRSLLLARRWRQRREWFLRMPGWLRIALLVAWPIGLPLGLVGIGTLTFLGPDFIAARARLAAFIDFYGEAEPIGQVEVPPPQEPRDWLARLIAPRRSLHGPRLLK